MGSSSRQKPDGESGFVTDLTRYQPTLHAFLTSILPGQSDLEDILQQTNIYLWEHRSDFKPGTSFKSWALTAARWQARAWLSKQKQQNWLIVDDRLADAVSSRFETAPPEEISDSLSALRSCLGKLKESDRLLVMSHYQHEKSLRKCSELFDRSVGSLKVALFRLRASLRRCVWSHLAIERTKP